MAMVYPSTGSPRWGIIYPVILTRLIRDPNVGFAWAQRICGLLSLFLVAIGMATIRSTEIARKGSLILLGGVQGHVLVSAGGVIFLVIFGLWTPYFYLRYTTSPMECQRRWQPI